MGMKPEGLLAFTLGELYQGLLSKAGPLLDLAADLCLTPPGSCPVSVSEASKLLLYSAANMEPSKLSGFSEGHSFWVALFGGGVSVRL